MLITVDNAKFSYGNNLIFEGSTSPKTKASGSVLSAQTEGKTTLIKLIMSELYFDCGKVIKKNGARI